MNLYLKMMRLFIFFAILFCVGCQENNFSDAALEEFFVLDRSLDANNKIIEQGIRIAAREIRVNAQEKIRYLPIMNKTDEIESISLIFHAYIDKLRDSLITESGGVYTKEAAEKQGKPELEGRPIGQNDTKIPHKIFILGENGSKGNKEPQGVVLYKKILNLRTAYIDAIAKMWNNGGVNGTTFADSSKKALEIKELKDEMTIYGIDDYRPEIHENKTWAEFTFEKKPVAAIYPILRKLQNDAKILEAIIVNFLHFQQSSIQLCDFGNSPFATALSSNPTVRLGETYEAQIALVEKVEDAVFTASVNNQNMKIEYGNVTYKTKPTTTGKKTYTAKFALTNPLTGEIQTYSKDFHYEVYQPFVNISADKMNIFYIGIDNSVTIGAAGITGSNMTVSITGGTLTKKSDTNYIVNVDEPGDCIITVKDNQTGQTFPFTFRTRRLPDPVARLGLQTDGLMGSGEFKAQRGISAWMENMDIDNRCIVVSYTLYYNPKGAIGEEIQGEGGRFEGKVADVIALAKPGDQYTFVDIKAKCPGEAFDRRLNCLAFKIK